MTLSLLDISIIFFYFVFLAGVGLYYRKRAGQSTEEFFLAGRKLPWWLAGTSMVATTFAVDTPLAVTGFIAKNGIAGNWFWWCGVIGNVMIVVIFSRLWRRAAVMTDAEIIELRYSGKPAAILRLFKSFYFGILVNCFIMGWVINAMCKVAEQTFGWNKLMAIWICCVTALFYTVLSGFWGVVVTNLVQFALATVGAFTLAIFAYIHVGGASGFEEKLAAIYGANHGILDFIPSFSGANASMPLTLFLMYVFVLWWSYQYSDGGGYLVQSTLACKNEREAFKATAWFTFAHYVLRSWPWIIVGVASLVVFPNLSDPELGYPKMMVLLLPSGFLGIMVTSLLAAFMSTIDTHLNWGASYLLNDIYRRFLNRKASSGHYVAVSRFFMCLVMALAGLVARQMESISAAWIFVIAFSAGAGLVFIARWFWWRVNAWSEISALISSGVISLIIYAIKPDWPLEYKLPFIIIGSTFCWVLVTYLTQPVTTEKLEEFYLKVKPFGPFWAIIDPAKRAKQETRMGAVLLYWGAGVVFIYAALFGVGGLLFGKYYLGAGLCLIATAIFFLILNKENNGKTVLEAEPSVA